MEKIIQFLKQYGILLALGIVGILILIYGVYGEVSAEKPVVEIIKSGSQPVRSDRVGSENGLQPTRSDLGGNEVVIDVAGAVEKPGLYKLTSGSRIGDALVMAGGLSATADREWVAKSINLAEVLKDGGKVYVPGRNVNNNQSSILNNQTNTNNQNSKLININTASMIELDGLMGIGEVRARLIMDNRPYGNIDELVSKAKIPQSVYEAIKDSISIY